MVLREKKGETVKSDSVRYQGGVLVVMLALLAMTPTDIRAEEGKKSPGVAFALSLLVPGAGELYAGGSKWWAGGFLATEAITWTQFFRWRSKGNDLKEDFRNYADQNWDEARYRAWQDYNQSAGEPFQENETLPCKDGSTDPSCEKHDTQQYYELIGKYDQFVFGWGDTQGVPITTFNPEVDSDMRGGYETQRNESNKYLKRSSVISGLAVVTRIVSAIHASAVVRGQNLGEDESRVRVLVDSADERGRPEIGASVEVRF